MKNEVAQFGRMVCPITMSRCFINEQISKEIYELTNQLTKQKRKGWKDACSILKSRFSAAFACMSTVV